MRNLLAFMTFDCRPQLAQFVTFFRSFLETVKQTSPFALSRRLLSRRNHRDINEICDIFFLFWKVSEHRARLYPIYPLQTLTLSPASFGKHFRPRMIPGDTSVVSARQVDDGSRGHVIDHKDMECERETETGKETKRGRLQWSVRGTQAQQGSILINERHFSKETLDCIVQDLFIDVTSERSVWVFVRAEVAFSVLLGTEQDE